MQWLAALVIMLQLCLPAGIPGLQSSNVEIQDLGVSHQFGQQISFKLQVSAPDKVRELLVFITPEGQPTVWQDISLDQANDLGEITQLVDARKISLTPFSKVGYRYEATLTNGEKVVTETRAFFYDDNRFAWQNIESGVFQAYWYSEDPTAGQEIINIAQEGLEHAQAILKADPPSPVRIYLYSSSADLQSALQLTHPAWVAGHASPDLGIVMVSVSSGPEWKLELERQIPHEIMHILQYQVVGKDYHLQPVWLIEGMASLNELFPNPEYQRVLETNARSQELIPFKSLCDSFPREAAPAFQAYAQSESFVRFLHEKYGASELRGLIAQYQNGLSCEDGFSAAYHTSLSQAEYRWRQEYLGMDANGLVLSNLSPYITLGCVILVPAALAFLPFRAGKRSLKEKKHHDH
jgi:hypothetical protein